jgi:hypothetical protein
MGFGLDDAGAGDEEEAAVADLDAASGDFEGIRHKSYLTIEERRLEALRNIDVSATIKL